MNILIRSIAAAFLSVSFLLAGAQGPDCADCPAIEVSPGDVAVGVTAEDAAEMGLTGAQYEDLRQVSAGLFSALREAAAGSGCLLVKEDAPYRVSGTLTKKSRRSVLIQAWVEVLRTGEKVAEAEQEYDLSLSGRDNGEAMARQLGPLGEKIMAFGRERRDRSPGTALGFGADTSRQVRIGLDRDTLPVNRSAEVSVTVADCDGEPLPGMSLQLAASGGSLQPGRIVTDAEGRAVVLYKAPCVPGDYALEVTIAYDRSYEQAGDQGGSFTARQTIRVSPGRNLWLHYEHAATQTPGGGQFTILSTARGVIACNIEEVPDSVKVTGTGMVVVDWSGDADPCIYSGRNSYRVNYFGLIVTGEDGSRWLEIAKTGQEPMGGRFSINCSGEVQEVESAFPIPDHESGRTLRFELTDGTRNVYKEPGSGSEYRYVLDLGCGQ